MGKKPKIVSAVLLSPSSFNLCHGTSTILDKIDDWLKLCHLIFHRIIISEMHLMCQNIYMGLYSYSSCAYFLHLFLLLWSTTPKFFANFHVGWNKILNLSCAAVSCESHCVIWWHLRRVTFQTLATLMYSFSCERSLYPSPANKF